MCGGAAHIRLISAPRVGLSPRVRGSPSRMPWIVSILGPIPACAGEPRSRWARQPFNWAYPRVCGGAYVKRRATDERRGLSPRVRGSLTEGPADCLCMGPIPACAGEPKRPPKSKERVWAYPRVCGGAFNHPFPLFGLLGLSPRVRGSRTERRGGGMAWGPIPACAGEPSGALRARLPIWAYPRVCGGAN